MDCIFCRIVAKTIRADIVYEDAAFMAFLDKHPRTRGHLQLIPKKHYTWVYDVPDMGKLFSTAQSIIRVIIPLLGADHVTLATFGHEVAHAHIWIVPQYSHQVQIGEGITGTGFSENQDTLISMLRKALSKEVSV